MSDNRVAYDSGRFIDQLGTQRGGTVIAGQDPLGTMREATVDRRGDLFAARRTFTQMLRVPGIGAAAAYASGDAFGTQLEFPVPRYGVIESLLFVDLDNERIPKDLVLFSRDFTATADNAAFDPSDEDMVFCLGSISILAGDYILFNDSSLAAVTSIGLAYEAPEGTIWGQLVTRGLDNIAAGSEPFLRLVIAGGGD